MGPLRIILVAIFAYFFLFYLIRLVGRKTLSQMTFFEFILGVTSGTVTAHVALDPDISKPVIVLIVMSLLTILIEYLSIMSLGFRKFANSEPVVLIENGKILQDNLLKVRLTMNNLNMHLRQKDVFNICDVEYALMEVNGQVSVLPKAQMQPLTPSDLKIPTPYIGLTKDIVIDGRLLQENLADAHLDEQWLKQELKKLGINDISEAFFVGLDTAGKLFVSEKRREIEKHGQHGIE